MKKLVNSPYRVLPEPEPDVPLGWKSWACVITTWIVGATLIGGCAYWMDHEAKKGRTIPSQHCK